MAIGKNLRTDPRRSSSSYCSTVTLVVFVALCLVGVWMMTSSAVVPFQNVDIAGEETKSAVKERVVDNESHQFENGSGDVPEDAMRGDSNSDTGDGNGSKINDNKNLSEETTKNDGVEKTDGGETNTEGGEVTLEGKETNTEGGEVNSEGKETNTEEGGETNDNEQVDNLDKNSEGKKQSEESSGGTTQDEKAQGETEEKGKQNQGNESEQNPNENEIEDNIKNQKSSEVFPDAAQSELLNETNTQNGAWSTQAAESKNEKEVQQSSTPKATDEGGSYGYHWQLCNVTAGPDYIPCLDNLQAIKKLQSTAHYEHRERHCPEEGPTCLVPIPEGYKRPIEWPNSRDKVSQLLTF